MRYIKMFEDYQKVRADVLRVGNSLSDFVKVVDDKDFIASDIRKEYIEPDISVDDIIKVIKEGGYIYAKNVKDYDNHKTEDKIKPIEIDNDGNISVEIDGHIYYTKLRYVYKIEL